MTRLSGGASLQVARCLGPLSGMCSRLCVRRNRHGIKERWAVARCRHKLILALAPPVTVTPAPSVVDRRGSLFGVDVKDTPQQCHDRRGGREALWTGLAGKRHDPCSERAASRMRITYSIERCQRGALDVTVQDRLPASIRRTSSMFPSPYMIVVPMLCCMIQHVTMLPDADSASVRSSARWRC